MGPSRGECPFDVETWSLNMGYLQIAEMHGRMDKIFLAHTQVKKHDGTNVFNWDEFNKFIDAGAEIINTHRVKALKKMTLYPMTRIAKKFNAMWHGKPYFSDTIAYMIAYALDKYTKVKDGKLVLTEPLKLRLYGADMQAKDEYLTEKAGLEWWLGLAQGLGVEVTITESSSLMATVNGMPYGTAINWKDIDPFNLRKRKGRLTYEQSLMKTKKWFEEGVPAQFIIKKATVRELLGELD